MFPVVPKDWPNRVKMAARAATDEAARREMAAEVVVLLRRADPLDLRSRGMDAPERQAVYTSQVSALIQAAA